MAKEYKTKTLKNGERRYIFDVNIGYRADGSRIRTTISAKSIKEGRKKVAELTLGKKEIITNDSMTFKEVFVLYHHDYRYNQGLNETTIAEKERQAKMFTYFDDMKINKIKKIDIQSWISVLESKNIKPERYNMELGVFFNWCIKKEIVNKSPVIKEKRNIAPKKKATFLTVEEFNVFLDALKSDEYKLLFTTIFYTGLRISEALGLKYEDIEGHEFHLSTTYKYILGKGEPKLSEEFKSKESVRIVPFPEWLDFGEGTGRIFNLKPSSVRRTRKVACERAGIKPFKTHELRHSYVAMLIDKGVDIFTIKEILGHESITMTMDVYGHLYDEKRKNISKLL